MGTTKRLTLTVTKRRDGRVCKHVDGGYRIWPSEQAARAELTAMIREREIRRTKRELELPAPDDAPMRMIANRFIHNRNDRGILPGSKRDYRVAIGDFLEVVGKSTLPSELKPQDFKAVRARWALNLGPWKLDNRIQSIRTMFKWALEVERCIDRLPWYGDEFHKSTASEKRNAARERSAEHGERKFSDSELKKIVNSRLLVGPLRAFVLLGMNFGFYAADCSDMRLRDLREEDGHRLIDDDRGKTGMRRKGPMWPETAKAIDWCLKRRHKSPGPGDEDLVFLTVHGNRWVREKVELDDDGLVKKSTTIDSVNLLFGRLLRAEGVKRNGVAFGALKHTHISAVAAHPDRNARHIVRGHQVAGIETHYDFPSIARLKAVTDLARKQLYLKHVKKAPTRRPKRARGRRPS